MHRKHLLGVVGALCAVIVVGASFAERASGDQAGNAMSSSCDRACLEGFVNRYLDAVVAHDPSRLPLAKFAKFTENGAHLELGDGFWRTATARGGYKFYVDDANAGQVGFIGTMQEAGQPVILALRLKIENQKISEIETIVCRGQMAQGGAASLEKRGEPRAAFLQDLPPSERESRLDLIKTANKYFSAMEQDDGKADYSFFADDCDRLENGLQTTNNLNPMPGLTASGQPRPAPSPKYDPAAKPTMYSAGWSCKDQFRSGLLHFVTWIHDRRYPVVDEERGVVFALGFFDHSAGATRTFQTPAGQTVTAGPTTPFTWEIAEVFKVRGGQLHEIEAALTQGIYGMCSGWSSWEDCRSDQPQW